jgi:hypothetical protein
MFRPIIAALVLGLGLAGGADAASKKMKEAAEQQPRPDADTALVVFLRSSFVGSAIQSTVYETEAAGQRFLGIVSNKTRLATRVAPGAHRFMVIAENADFLEATVEAGKTYYVLISPRPGMWKARFSLLPIRNDQNAQLSLQSADFAKWMKKTTLVEIAPEAEEWYREHQASINKKRDGYLKKWDRMTPADKSELTLNPEDGV